MFSHSSFAYRSLMLKVFNIKTAGMRAYMNAPVSYISLQVIVLKVTGKTRKSCLYILVSGGTHRRRFTLPKIVFGETNILHQILLKSVERFSIWSFVHFTMAVYGHRPFKRYHVNTIKITNLVTSYGSEI